MDNINSATDPELRNQLKYVALSRATNIAYAVSSKAQGMSPDVDWNMSFKAGTKVDGKSDKLSNKQVKSISKEDMKSLKSFEVRKNTDNGIHTFKVTDKSSYTEAAVKLLAMDYPGGLFLVNGFTQTPGERMPNTTSTNSVFVTMDPGSMDYVTTKYGPNTRHDKPADSKNKMTDETYDENIKLIDEDLNRWETSDKVLIFDEMGYGQYMIGVDEMTGQKVGPATAPRTFQYLSAKLLEKFGFINPNYLSTPAGVAEVQKYQDVTDAELIEQKKVCKLQ